jgi:hypothetical protein
MSDNYIVKNSTNCLVHVTQSATFSPTLHFVHYIIMNKRMIMPMHTDPEQIGHIYKSALGWISEEDSCVFGCAGDIDGTTQALHHFYLFSMAEAMRIDHNFSGDKHQRDISTNALLEGLFEVHHPFYTKTCLNREQIKNTLFELDQYAANFNDEVEHLL